MDLTQIFKAIAELERHQEAEWKAMYRTIYNLEDPKVRGEMMLYVFLRRRYPDLDDYYRWKLFEMSPWVQLEFKHLLENYEFDKRLPKWLKRRSKK
jgi:hypothetical protein